MLDTNSGIETNIKIQKLKILRSKLTQNKRFNFIFE